MTTYTLTAAVNNFLGTSLADTFSGVGGGVDNLSGAAGADTFTIDGNQTGIIDGGSEVDTVNITDNQLDLGLSFTKVETLNATSSISNLYATATQLSAFASINVASAQPDFYFFLQGQGGAVDFSTRFLSPKLLHVEAAMSTSAVQLTGTAHADNFLGSNFNDTLNGGGDNDILFGSAGNDILNGGTGADTMQGGTDNDTYYVDNAGDVVDESYFGGGIDSVRSSNISINLSDAVHFVGDVDNVFLEGTLNLSATGNGLQNYLYGNTGNNSLSGGAGNDVLDGKVGADSMDGGANNDTYYVDNAGDKVIEAVGNGIDTVYASTTFKLAAAAEVEVLRTTNQAGVDAINLTGSDYNNLILGNAGANVLDGRDGADTLSGLDGADILKGGLGNDILNGGAGNDQFVFNTTLSINNIDTISDFTSAGNADVIVLDDAIFSALNAGSLASGAAFTVNATGAAGDADDRIIYQSTTGKLFYDADGVGTGEDAVHFATLTGKPMLAVDDFLVV